MNNVLPLNPTSPLHNLLALIAELDGKISTMVHKKDAPAEFKEIAEVVAKMKEFTAQLEQGFGKQIDGRFSMGLGELYARLTEPVARILQDHGLKDFLSLVLKKNAEVLTWPGMSQGRLEELESILKRSFGLHLGMSENQIVCWDPFALYR